MQKQLQEEKEKKQKLEEKAEMMLKQAANPPALYGLENYLHLLKEMKMEMEIQGVIPVIRN